MFVQPISDANLLALKGYLKGPSNTVYGKISGKRDQMKTH